MDGSQFSVLSPGKIPWKICFSFETVITYKQVYRVHLNKGQIIDNFLYCFFLLPNVTEYQLTETI